MKNIVRCSALLAVFAFAFAACGDKPVNPTPGSEVDNTPKERVIVYTIDDSESRQTLETEGEWDVLLGVLCNQAKDGSKVTFYNMTPTTYFQNKGANGTKAAKTFSTTSLDEMKDWMKKMEKEGRTVTVTYNNGTWNGVAYATAPSSDTATTIIGTWQFHCLIANLVNSDGNLENSEIYVPEDQGTILSYTFYDNGTLTFTFQNGDGTTVTDEATWTLSGEGKLCSELLPNGGGCWDVNWITDHTLIMSRSDFGTEEGDLLYQLQFERQ